MSQITTMPAMPRPRALSVALARSHAVPWWWRHVDHGIVDVELG